MTKDKNQKIREIGASLRLAALNLDSEKFPNAKEELVRIAQDLNSYLDQSGPYDSQPGSYDPQSNMSLGEPVANLTETTAPAAPSTDVGKYDIHRQPDLPLWNLQILRIYASNGQDAHNIVNQLVDILKQNGHPMAAVGEIKQATDQTTPKGAGR